MCTYATYYCIERCAFHGDQSNNYIYSFFFAMVGIFTDTGMVTERGSLDLFALFLCKEGVTCSILHMAVFILLVSSVFCIQGGTGVLLRYIGYNESILVYTDAPYLDKKQVRNRHMVKSPGL